MSKGCAVLFERRLPAARRLACPGLRRYAGHSPDSEHQASQSIEGAAIKSGSRGLQGVSPCWRQMAGEREASEASMPDYTNRFTAYDRGPAPERRLHVRAKWFKENGQAAGLKMRTGVRPGWPLRFA